MTSPTLMQGFPPRPDDRATLANWRERPYSAWAFHHVRELIPTAAVPADAAAGLAEEPADVLAVAFEDPAGAERTVGEVLARGDVDGFVMFRGGRLIAERYFNLYDGARPHLLFSVTKSVTALLAGILADRERLDPDGRVLDLVPEAEGSAYGECTVRHLLDMSVSVTFEEDYFDPAGDVIRYRHATGWNPPEPGTDPGDLRTFLTGLRSGEKPHGKAFHYVSPNSDMLGWVIERAARRRYADLLSELIWRPLGAGRDADVTVDRLGAPRAAGGLSATVRDLARLGEMVRHRGMAEGRRVVPAWWIDDIFRGGDRAAWKQGEFAALAPEGGYRAQWYQTGPVPSPVMAIGIHGQWLHVDPESETVIAALSCRNAPSDDPDDVLMMRMLSALAGAMAVRTI